MVGSANTAGAQVQGNIVDGQAENTSIQPVLAGGNYNSALPSYSSGNRTTLQTDASGRLIMRPMGTLTQLANAGWTIATNKASVVVPAGQVWQILYGFGTFTASSTVGNRLIKLSVFDASSKDVLWKPASATVAASSTSNISFGAFGEAEAGQSHGTFIINTGSLAYVPAGFKIQLWDDQNVDGTGDLWSNMNLLYALW